MNTYVPICACITRKMVFLCMVGKLVLNAFLFAIRAIMNAYVRKPKGGCHKSKIYGPI